MARHRFPNTRERIERAAIQLFVEKGIDGTSVRDVARLVDISEGALYRHFTGKDELVWQVFERHYVAFAGRLEALAAPENTARAKLAAMIRGFCQAYEEDPLLFRFLLFVQHGQLKKLAPGSPTPVDAVQNVIADGIAAREIPDQPAALAAALVFGIVLQPVTFTAYGRLSDSLTSVCDRLIAASWAAVTTV
jgi:AcrR family transcriptional regulator